MQFYGFQCPNCGEQFETKGMTFAEYDEMMENDPPKCDDCDVLLIRSYAPQIKWNTSGGTGASL